MCHYSSTIVINTLGLFIMLSASLDIHTTQVMHCIVMKTYMSNGKKLIRPSNV